MSSSHSTIILDIAGALNLDKVHIPDHLIPTCFYYILVHAGIYLNFVNIWVGSWSLNLRQDISNDLYTHIHLIPHTLNYNQKTKRSTKLLWQTAAKKKYISSPIICLLKLNLRSELHMFLLCLLYYGINRKP